MKSKTIIISSQDSEEKGRGILTIYMEDDLLKCKLRLYNIPILNRYCKLGLYHNNEVYSANLLEKNGSYTSSFVGNFDLDKDFYTAIIDTSKNNEVILCGGTYSGFFFNNQNVFNHIEKENPKTNLIDYDEEVENAVNHSLNNDIFDETKNIFQTSLEDEHKKVSSQNSSCDRCEHCKYKEFFYSQQEIFSQQENFSTSAMKSSYNKECLHRENNVLLNETKCNKNITQTKQAEPFENLKTNQTKQENSIINSIVPQFEYVFENYTADEILNKLIPYGRFVKINENQEQFSIGAIYEDNDMKYICYAVLKNYNAEPPQELGEHYQWLPLDKEDPLSEGYFIVFQDANDLKIVEM